MSNRIVVTGLGTFSPLGANVESTWNALLAGESGIRLIGADWVEKYSIPVTFAGTVKESPADHLEKVQVNRLDPVSQYALIAALEAWNDAGAPEVEPEKLGVDWATGIGGVWTLLSAWDTIRDEGVRRVKPLTVPMLMPNAPAAAVGMTLGARAGIKTVVSACASSTESIGEAIEHLRSGKADVVVTGGSEAAIHPMPIASFAQMRALSKRNDDPATASRPFDVDRDGFVLGEGAAALVLEREDHAIARGARIYAVIGGAAYSSDAHHITAPDPEGTAAARAMLEALGDAGLTPADVTHVNAHATSTPVGDVTEAGVLRQVFGERTDSIPVTATKGATGHLLGGAGAIEAVFSVLTVFNRVIPPTINLQNQDPAITLDVVREPRQLDESRQVVVSNSFGFGGANAVVVVQSYDGVQA